jgi:hypothetical protein
MSISKQNLLDTLNGFYGTTLYTDFNKVPLEILQLAVLLNSSSSDTTGSVTVTNTGFLATQSGTWNINNISGTITLPTGAATDTTLSTLSAKLPSALVAGRLSVDGSGVTQPISVASLPLPSGAATSAKQPALGVAGTPSTDVITVQGINSGTPQPVSIASLPLPTGAATESTLSTLNGKLPNALVSGRLSVDGSGVTQPVSLTSLPSLAAGSNAIGSITNTSFAATQSGTWNITNISGTVSLPTGAATSAKQPTLGTAGTPSSDVISVQGVSNGTALTINQQSNATTTTTTFTSSTTSSPFTIANRLAIIVCPIVTGAPTLTLQVTLDSGTTWVSTSVALTSSATVATVIEADLLAKLSGAFGLTNAFRFSSSASITSATLNIRSIVQ